MDATSDNNQTGTIAIGRSALGALTSGGSNTAIGYESQLYQTDGANNTTLGYKALRNADNGESLNTVIGTKACEFVNHASSDGNTAVGTQALVGGTGVRDYNVALGYRAMGSGNTQNDIAASNNVFIGAYSGNGTWTGSACNLNTAVGYQSMQGAMNGALENSAFGANSLVSLTEGNNNVAVGANAGDAITTTSACTLVGHDSGTNINHNDAEGTVAYGYQSLKLLTNGRYNTAIGYASLASSANGDKNTAVGFQSLGDVTGSSDGENTAIGFNAGHTGTDNITSGTQNTLIGASTQATASGAVNQTVIGYGATSQSNNSVTLGNSSVTSIFAPTKTAIQSYGTVAITDGSTITLAGSNLGAAILCIYEASGGIGGVFALSYQFAAVQLAGSSDTSTSDSAGDVCVINGTNNHTVTIKNNTGAQKNFRIMIYSAAFN